MEFTFKKGVLPVLVLRDTVLFPGAAQQLDIVRQRSVRAVSGAIESGKSVLIVMQKDQTIDDPQPDELCNVGVVAEISQVQRRPSSDTMRIRVECGPRAKIMSAELTPSGMISAVCEALTEKHYKNETLRKAITNSLREDLHSYLEASEMTPPRAFAIQLGKEMPVGELADFIASNAPLSGEKKQSILEEPDTRIRCEKLIAIIRGEVDIIELKQDIETKVGDAMDKNQHDYYLREQIKVISEELGDGDTPLRDADEFREKIAILNLSQEASEKLLQECAKLAKLPQGSHEASVQRSYIETCLSLPWGIQGKEKISVSAARKKLDQDHYGLEKVKERILEYIAVRALAPGQTAQIICLAGPPGVGKTSIARSIAETLGRKYARLSLGGVHDEADIRGHRRTYIGSMPGRIINSVIKAGTMNPLILLDEIDKLSKDYRGDPTSALLELLDPEQNSTFHDHYIDIPFDLSGVLFITTANDVSRIPTPLLDRMEIINIPSYTAEEKFHIAKKYLVKKQMKKHGLLKDKVSMMKITDKAIYALIDGYTREAGVRSLERKIAAICRKAAREISESDKVADSIKVAVTDYNLSNYLGSVKYKPEIGDKFTDPGIVKGLAFTSVGGTMLEIEAAVLTGSGKVELTGSLGEVMRESARTAISFIRSRADDWGIDSNFHKDKDIHIHAPEGAVPKDGPSAGITMATAIISALTGIPARSDVAMTGEITLIGRVLPIGGLREKTMAAYRSGIKTVIIPEKNKPDIDELSDTVKNKIHFVTADRMDDVIVNVLVRMPEKRIAKPESLQKSKKITQNSGEKYIKPISKETPNEPSTSRI